MSKNTKIIKFPKKKRQFNLNEKEQRIFVFCFFILAIVVFIIVEAWKSKLGF